MLELLAQILQLVDILIISLGVLYLLGNRWLRHRIRKARLANALLVEIQTVRDIFRKTDNTTEIENAEHHHNTMRIVYDGLLTSSNIAYFDSILQRKIHGAYMEINNLLLQADLSNNDDKIKEIKMEQSQIDRKLRIIDESIIDIKLFCERQNEGRWFRLLKKLRFEYGD